ncbi:hypothetical protein D9M71_762360 [compost metagenome]
MGIATLGDLVPGVGRVNHALEAEQHVVGVQAAAWLEVTSAVKLDLRAQLEFVDQAVWRNCPALGQAGYDLALDGIEFDQAVHQDISRGVGGSQ